MIELSCGGTAKAEREKNQLIVAKITSFLAVTVATASAGGRDEEESITC